jgi:hypothetical protein
VPIEVRCAAEGGGYRCQVTVSDGRGSTTHSVRVSAADLHRWGRGRSAEQLVGDSFQFLLARESKESILRDFDLAVIKHYFPEYDGAA